MNVYQLTKTRTNKKISQPDMNYTALFGLYNLVFKDKGSFKVGIDKIIKHPQYQDLFNDIALMHLNRPVEFNENVQPICLIDHTRDIFRRTKDLICYVVGYGKMADMLEAKKQQKLAIRVLPQSECNALIMSDLEFRPNTICIGPPSNKKGGTCFGDSGGPSHCYDPIFKRWFQFGIVSTGPPTCEWESQWLSVSTDLSSYRTWIITTILDHNGTS